ncbi:MAG: hypothetical protein GF364_01320 [Candidatus Lokiarchaeota archaeon]|nr:hypothetical protein [Candidatus Lokiarchaeota archaeon]
MKNRLLIFLLFFFLILLSFTLSIFAPYHNWDMIGYIAASKAFETSDVKLLHDYTFSQLKTTVSDSEYIALTTGNQYRKIISANPAAFEEQLVFYQIRPIYTSSIYLLSKVGLKIGFATHLISGISIGISLLLVYFLTIRFLSVPFALTIPLFLLLFRIPNLARYSSPDGLAFLAVITSIYLLITQRIFLLLFLLPLLLGIRTDLILFTIPLMVYIFLFYKYSRLWPVLSLIFSLIVYFFIAFFWKNPGWTTIFYFTFVEILPYPLSAPPELTINQYAIALVNGFKNHVINESFLVYLIGIIYSFFVVRDDIRKNIMRTICNPWLAIIVICSIYLTLHFFAFPIPEERFYSGYYFLCVFSFYALLNEKLELSRLTDSIRCCEQ